MRVRLLIGSTCILAIVFGGIFLSPPCYGNIDKGISIDESLIFPGDRMTCGIQCLYVLAGIHGLPANLESMVNMVPYDKEGATMLQLKRVAESLGFECKGYKAAFRNLNELHLPAIVHLKESHYVLLISIGKKTVRIADPPRNLGDVKIEEFLKKWSGNVLVCIPPDTTYETNTKEDEKRSIYIENSVWDLGTCPSGITYKHAFNIINASSEEIKIVDTKTSCGCTVASFADERLSPGKKTHLEVALHTAGRTGPFRGDIAIKTNHPAYPVLSAKISADFKLYKGGLVAFPQKVAWGEILYGNGASRKIEIKRKGEDPLGYEGVLCDNPRLTIRTVDRLSSADFGSRNIVLEVLLDPNMPVGPFEDTITVQTQHSKYPQIEIPLQGEVVSDLKATPRTLFLNAGSGGSITRKIDVQSRGHKPFKITDVTFNSSDFGGTLTYSKVTETSWEVVAVMKDFPSKQLVKDNIIIETDSEQAPRILIPVTVISSSFSVADSMSAENHED